MGGMLASIGLEKGKPFVPKGKVKKALEQAAEDGYAYLEYLFETPRLLHGPLLAGSSVDGAERTFGGGFRIR